MKRFELFDTTADVGLTVYGRNFIELLENSASGLSSLITEPFESKDDIIKKIEFEEENREILLVSLLSELIFLFETAGFLMNKIHGKKIDNNKYSFSLEGETYSPKKHTLLTQIKAVTYHNLEIKTKGDILTVNIVFDV
jgi:SHS2 domain-containing protein